MTKHQTGDVGGDARRASPLLFQFKSQSSVNPTPSTKDPSQINSEDLRAQKLPLRTVELSIQLTLLDRGGTPNGEREMHRTDGVEEDRVLFSGAISPLKSPGEGVRTQESPWESSAVEPERVSVGAVAGKNRRYRSARLLVVASRAERERKEKKCGGTHIQPVSSLAVAPHEARVCTYTVKNY